MVSALDSDPERAVRVRVLAGDIVLFSWERHFTLTLSLSIQVYKWVPANCKHGKVLCCLNIAHIISLVSDIYIYILRALGLGKVVEPCRGCYVLVF